MARKKQDEREAFYSRNLPTLLNGVQGPLYGDIKSGETIITLTDLDGKPLVTPSLYDLHATILGLSIALSRCSDAHGTGKTLRGLPADNSTDNIDKARRPSIYYLAALECPVNDLVRYGYGLGEDGIDDNFRLMRRRLEKVLVFLDRAFWNVEEISSRRFIRTRVLTIQTLQGEGPLNTMTASLLLSSYFTRDAKGFGQMPSDYMQRLRKTLRQDVDDFNARLQRSYEHRLRLWEADPQKFDKPEAPKPKRARRCTTAHICLAIFLGQQDRRKPFSIKMTTLAEKTGLRENFRVHPGRTLAQLEQVVRDTCEAMGIERAVINYQRYAPSDPPRPYSLTINWTPAVVSTTSISAPADASLLKNSSQNKSPRKKPRT